MEDKFSTLTYMLFFLSVSLVNCLYSKVTTSLFEYSFFPCSSLQSGELVHVFTFLHFYVMIYLVNMIWKLLSKINFEK